MDWIRIEKQWGEMARVIRLRWCGAAGERRTPTRKGRRRAGLVGAAMAPALVGCQQALLPTQPDAVLPARGSRGAPGCARSFCEH